MKLNPFSKKTETEESKAAELVQSEPLTPEIISSLPEQVKEQYLSQLAERYGLKLSFDRSELRTTHEEVAPQVITILTDLDHNDPETNESVTNEDKWGFWKDYHGTKGKVFDTEVPQMQFGHLGAIMPALRNKVYKYIYDIDKKTGLVKRDNLDNPVIIKKIRINLIVELSNLKVRNNLAEMGYARGQQERVIIGGIGQVTPMSEGLQDKALDLMFGKRK